MNLNTARVLRLAASQISDGTTWTQGAWARDWFGNEQPACDGRARSWCAEGALYKACRGDMVTWTAAAEVLREVIGQIDIKHWNDSRLRTRVEVVGAMLTAARNAGGRHVA